MKTTPMTKVSVIAVFLALFVPLSAQFAKIPATPAELEFRLAQEALTVRGDAAAAISGGAEKSATVIARLKTHDSPSGLKIDKEADFAFAAID
ncbi:MAG: hypothetical protein HY302_13330, partial [Opitutae bacterium]|nr:hypothetical protein [Opitutae bacterium]